MTVLALGLLRRAIRRYREVHGALIRAVLDRPIVLLFSAIFYAGLTYLLAVLSRNVGESLGPVLWGAIPESHRPPDLNYQIAKYLFLSLFACEWVHYLFLTLRCVYAAIQRKLIISSVVQLVFVLVFVFAAAHYYVALFSDDESYKGAALPRPEVEWADFGEFEDRFFFMPKVETVVDFIYFSAVTSATVGYGDIYPVTILARLLTTVQIGLSFTLVVVVLGVISKDNLPKA